MKKRQVDQRLDELKDYDYDDWSRGEDALNFTNSGLTPLSSVRVFVRVISGDFN